MEKIFFYTCLLVFSHFFTNAQTSKWPYTDYVYAEKINKKSISKLKLIGKNGIKQLESSDNERFDLSGITVYKDKIYVVADKKWNNMLYKLDTTFNSFTIKPDITICPDDKIDFEGVDVCAEQIYLIDEWYDNAHKLNPDSCNLQKIDIKWANLGIDRSGWGNRGFEGMAVDCPGNILYLAKEREPRRIFKVDIKTGNVSEPFINVLGPHRAGYDISDMKFENGYLYILERGIGRISRINTNTKETISYSFQDIVFKKGQRIFSNRNPEYGMAEALLLTKDQIWVGVDNNGDPVSEYGKSLGLKANSNTIILIFDRPEGF